MGMYLTYRAVKMQICKFLTWREVAVYTPDGCDYLYTHYFIVVECIYNRGATASVGGRPIGRDTSDGDGDDPPVAVPALREWLKQPRQALVVSAGDTIILESPTAFFDGVVQQFEEDANRGPQPVAADVEYIGYMTYRVRFAVQTWIREDTVPVSPLIANRWQTTETIDESMLSTIHVRGQAVFRGDLLQYLGLNADQFRRKFMFRPMGGYQRKDLSVTIDASGLIVDYTFKDEQQIWTMKPDRRLVKVTGKTLFANGVEINLSAVGSGAAAGFRQAGILGGIVGGVGAFIGTSLPKGSATLVVDAYGSRFATRVYLASVCIDIAGRLGFLDLQQRRLPGTTQLIDVDFPARHAHGQFTLTANAFQQLIGAAQLANTVDRLLRPLARWVALDPDNPNARFNVNPEISLPHYMNLSDPNAVDVAAVVPTGPVRGFLDVATPFWNQHGFTDTLRHANPNEALVPTNNRTDPLQAHQQEWPAQGTRAPTLLNDFNYAATFVPRTSPANIDNVDAFPRAFREQTLRFVRQALAAPLPDWSVVVDTDVPGNPSPLAPWPVDQSRAGEFVFPSP